MMQSLEKPSDPDQTPTQLTLIIGDDNFTFTPAFLESRHHQAREETVEVASCLPEEKIPNDFRPNYLALTSQGITIHFGINPAQLRNHFFKGQYSRIIFILPGIGFSGFPSFLDKQQDPLFKLRLHMYAFGFLKSSKNALRPDSIVQFLWPRQLPETPEVLPSTVPWHGIDISKIGPFCEMFRAETHDEDLDASSFNDWHPLIHNEPTPSFPAYLHDCVFYSWRVTASPEHVPNDVTTISETSPTQAHCQITESNDKSQQGGNNTEHNAATVNDDKDSNLLFVPPELWNYPVEILPHVNELFKFEMKTHNGDIMIVSKPTLKFDPRFRSDGGPAKNPFAKRGGFGTSFKSGRRGRGIDSIQHPRPTGHIPAGTGCHPPPPPPPDCSNDSSILMGQTTFNQQHYHPTCHPNPDSHGGQIPLYHGDDTAQWYAAVLDNEERMMLDDPFSGYNDSLGLLHYGTHSHHSLRTKRGRLNDSRLLGDIERYAELGLPYIDHHYGDTLQQHDDVLMYESLEQNQYDLYYDQTGLDLHNDIQDRHPGSTLRSSSFNLLRERQYIARMNRERVLAAADQVLLNAASMDNELLYQQHPPDYNDAYFRRRHHLQTIYSSDIQSSSLYPDHQNIEQFQLHQHIPNLPEHYVSNEDVLPITTEDTIQHQHPSSVMAGSSYLRHPVNHNNVSGIYHHTRNTTADSSTTILLNENRHKEPLSSSNRQLPLSTNNDSTTVFNTTNPSTHEDNLQQQTRHHRTDPLRLSHSPYNTHTNKLTERRDSRGPPLRRMRSRTPPERHYTDSTWDSRRTTLSPTRPTTIGRRILPHNTNNTIPQPRLISDNNNNNTSRINTHRNRRISPTNDHTGGNGRRHCPPDHLPRYLNPSNQRKPSGINNGTRVHHHDTYRSRSRDCIRGRHNNEDRHRRIP